MTSLSLDHLPEVMGNLLIGVAIAPFVYWGMCAFLLVFGP
jgi:hypothetical protein